MLIALFRFADSVLHGCSISDISVCSTRDVGVRRGEMEGPLPQSLALVKQKLHTVIVSRRHTKTSKGKAIPVQAWAGPEGSRRLRLPDFKTIGTRRW